MTLGEQRRKALELLAPPPSRHDHSGVVRPLSYSRPHQAGTTTPMAASRASRGSASSKPSIIGVLAERHARHLAERAQTLQDACKPMHTDPSTIWVICYQRTTTRTTPQSLEVLVSFGIMAIVPIPISRNAFASATMRSIEATGGRGSRFRFAEKWFSEQ